MRPSDDTIKEADIGNGARSCGRWFAFSLIGAAVLGCGGAHWEVRSVDEYEGSLTLDLASCNATYDIDVEEFPREIRIDVHQLTPTDPPGAECADSERVELTDPVGGRAVIVNGDRFEIN